VVGFNKGDGVWHMDIGLICATEDCEVKKRGKGPEGGVRDGYRDESRLSRVRGFGSVTGTPSEICLYWNIRPIFQYT